MFQIDIKKLGHLNRRVKQLKSYKGTSDELFGDNGRLAVARKTANAFVVRMLFYHLGGDGRSEEGNTNVCG